jgi:hypothetical protein
MKQIILIFIFISIATADINLPTEFDASKYIEQLADFCFGQSGFMCSQDLFDFISVYVKSKVLYPTKPIVEEEIEKALTENQIEKDLLAQDQIEQTLPEKQMEKQIEKQIINNFSTIKKKESRMRHHNVLGLGNFWRMNI